MKPLIGITTTEIGVKTSWVPISYGINQQYVDAVSGAGGVPVLVPFLDEDGLRTIYDRLDGVLFPGGNDVDPALYGEEPTPRTRDVSPERDRVESTLMKWALADDKPVLAICRGFQLLNVVLGGSLYQDLSRELPGASDHELSTLKEDRTHIAHTLTVMEGSLLASVTESLELAANSHHHQGVKRLAGELRASAWSEDNLVEAIEHPDRRFVIGLQCHPESLVNSDAKWSTVFSRFAEASMSPITRDNYASKALSSSRTS